MWQRERISSFFKELVGAFGRNADDGKVPAVFAGETVLLGKDEIEENFRSFWKKAKHPMQKWKKN